MGLIFYFLSLVYGWKRYIIHFKNLHWFETTPENTEQTCLFPAFQLEQRRIRLAANIPYFFYYWSAPPFNHSAPGTVPSDRFMVLHSCTEENVSSFSPVNDCYGDSGADSTAVHAGVGGSACISYVLLWQIKLPCWMLMSGIPAARWHAELGHYFLVTNVNLLAPSGLVHLLHAPLYLFITPHWCPNIYSEKSTKYSVFTAFCLVKFNLTGHGCVQEAEFFINLQKSGSKYLLDMLRATASRKKYLRLRKKLEGNRDSRGEPVLLSS